MKALACVTVLPILDLPSSHASRLARFALIGLLGLLSLSASGCASTGTFTWYQDIPKGPDWNTDNSEYVIGVGDTISIRAYEQEGLSGSYKVRRDGRIALPLAGELTVAGKHPSQLSKEIEVLLKQYIVSPRVTVNVDTSQPVTVIAIGEIKAIGALTLEPPARLIEAIAQAGGPNDFADKSRIFVLRRFPQFERIRFTYDAIVHNEGGAANFPLRTGDVLVVE
ncbi:MAG: polysaccharide biosynthesis/export family protein [Polyangiaceae bacterium]